MPDTPPFLLVPIAVEALTVCASDLHNTLWSMSEKNYTGMSRFESIEPPPFVRGNDRPRQGVTLHWALPDALTKGRQKGEQLLFPFIPNRWLVLRSARTKSGKPVQPLTPVRAWFLESDHLGLDGVNLYPAEDGQSATRLGRGRVVGETLSAASVNGVFLTALGGVPGTPPKPGNDPAFAAYAPNVDNVLSSYDDLKDLGLAESDGARLSYLVAGWYSDASADPMNALARVGKPWVTQEDCLAILKEYSWIVDGAGHIPTAGLPRRTLCHGVVFNVNWTGFVSKAQTFTRGADSPFTGTPIGDRKEWRNPEFGKGPNADQLFADNPNPTNSDLPHIAIGNSTTDALAAIVEYLADKDNRGDLGTLFQALEYNLVDSYNEPGGTILLNQKIRQSWFTPVGGETSWEVVAPRKLPDPKKKDLVAEDAPVDATKIAGILKTAGLTASLEKLNEVQALYDDWQPQLTRALRDFYGLWWKQQRLRFLRDLPEDVSSRTAFDTLVTDRNNEIDTAVTGLSARVAAALRQRDQLRDALHAALKTGTLDANGKNPLELMERPGARFFRPADPVAVVYGCKRSTKHGADGTLACRLSGQTVGTLDTRLTTLDKTARVAGVPALINAAAIRALFKMEAASTLVTQATALGAPDPVWDLAAEWILLDPGWAGALVNAVGALDANTIADVNAAQRLIWADQPGTAVTPAAMLTAAGFTDGARPSPLAVAQWAQPWSPLYLCWRVTWYPTKYRTEISPLPVVKSMPEWEFNGEDFDWTGIGSLDHDRAVTLQGRCILAGTSTAAVRQNLEKLLESNLPRLDAAAKRKLSELQEVLANADILSQPLTGFHEQLIQLDRNQYYTPPKSDLTSPLGDLERLAPIPFRNGAPDDFSHFFPIRAGHFQIARVWVVDGFGQVFDPIQQRGQTPGSYSPLRGSGLTTVGLSQRGDTQVLQLPPRIVQGCRLQFRFERDQPSTGVVLNTNPVCGWVLPNHFDQSLAVFDADGESLGAMLLSGSQGPLLGIIWEPGAIATPSQIPDEHLRGLVRSLMGISNNGGALQNFLSVVDRTLWSIDPLGKRDSNLSALVGRPIAVVRARLQLELYGAPATDQLWKLTGKAETKGFTDVEFPVQLGNMDLPDDGTLGYFEDANYSEFHTVHDLAVRNSTYIVLPGQSRLKVAANGTRKFITLLLDPRGSVTAEAGVVPAKLLRLPRNLIERPLENMDVTFRVGPLLQQQQSVRMPLPAEIRGGWSWIQKSGVGLLATEVSEVTPSTHQARLSDTPARIREGWLKLSDAVGKNDK